MVKVALKRYIAQGLAGSISMQNNTLCGPEIIVLSLDVSCIFVKLPATRAFIPSAKVVYFSKEKKSHN